MEVNNVPYRSLSTAQSESIKQLNLSSADGPKRVFYWKDTAEFAIIGVSPYLDKVFKQKHLFAIMELIILSLNIYY